MTSKNRFPLMLMIALSLTPVISIYFPRFLAFWPLIIGLGTSYWFIFIKKELFRISRLYYLSAGLISILGLISVTWSISPMHSLCDALIVSVMLLFGGLLVSSFNALETGELKPYAWLFPAGLIAAALLCAFDSWSGLHIYYLFHHRGSNASIDLSVMNRGIICCVFAFFLSLPFIQNLDWTKKQKILLASISGISVIIMLTLSESQSAQIAFVFGLICFFIFPARWRFSYITLGLTVLFSMLATPLIVDLMYEHLINYAQANDWVKQAYVGNRVEIWHFIMQYAMNNPIYGYGIEATNYVRHFDFEHLYNEKNTVLPPHNFSVQIWMEFGLIGIIIAMIILSNLIYALYHINDILVRKTLTVLFIIVLLTSSMTYGLWQSWWVGELLFLLGLSTLLSNIHIPTSPKHVEEK